MDLFGRNKKKEETAELKRQCEKIEDNIIRLSMAISDNRQDIWEISELVKQGDALTEKIIEKINEQEGGKWYERIFRKFW
jgi:hypothetical protein